MALSTPDVEVALRSVEAYEGRSLLLIDNFHLSPSAHAALAWLVASPGLRQRVRVIGMAMLEYPGLSEGALDASILMSFNTPGDDHRGTERWAGCRWLTNAEVSARAASALISCRVDRACTYLCLCESSNKQMAIAF